MHAWRTTRFRFFLFSILCTLACQLAFAEMAFERDFREGENALQRQNYAEALRIFSRLLPIAPENPSLNFAYGMASLGAGDASRAEFAFQRVLALKPDHHRARLELARALVALQRYPEARQQLNRVLQTDPPPAVRRNIQAYLRQISLKEPQQRRHFISIEAGAFYDTNVNVGPEADSISIRPLFQGPFVFTELELDEDSKPKKDWGTFLSGRGLYQIPVGSSSKWSTELGVLGYASQLSEQTDYNLFYYQLSTTAIRRPSQVHDLRLPMRYMHMYRGGNSLMQSVGTGVRYNARLNAEQRITLLTDLQWRDYTDQQGRDGFMWLNTFAIDQLLGTKQHIAGMAVTYYEDFADDAIYQKYGIRLTLHCAIRLGWRITYHSRVHFFKDSYEEPEALAPENRTDKQFQFMNGIRRRFRDNMQLDLSHQYTKNHSSFGLYLYTRNITTISVAYNF